MNSFNHIQTILSQTLHNLSPETEERVNLWERSIGIYRENVNLFFFLLVCLFDNFYSSAEMNYDRQKNKK